ncbi:MAG: glycoside hydrolase family 16 protein [Bacteroidales bacterium]|nr:glycoside hydrolase family 16 protein [Bacteroidales bacterium]
MQKIIIAAMLFLGAQLHAQDWQLVWSDEFNGDKPDTACWNIEVNGRGGGNNELQYYTDRDKNLRVENGVLVIEAHKEAYLEKEYTSARMNTRGKIFFKFGKITARMKLPYGQGIWPAFWMLGENIGQERWPRCGEIDIMEMIGGKEGDKTTHSTIHWYGSNGHKYQGSSYTLESGKLSDNYHEYSVVWNEKELTFFIDSVQVFQIDITATEFDAFRKNFHILLNLAVGGNWPGNPDETTIFPQQLQVDYVRVYQPAE